MTWAVFRRKKKDNKSGCQGSMKCAVQATIWYCISFFRYWIFYLFQHVKERVRVKSCMAWSSWKHLYYEAWMIYLKWGLFRSEQYIDESVMFPKTHIISTHSSPWNFHNREMKNNKQTLALTNLKSHAIRTHH